MAWLNALLAVVVVFTYVVGTLLVWNGFQAYPDHSPPATFRWIAMYAMAVIMPIGSSLRYFRVLRARGLETDRQLRRLGWAPMVAGGITLLIALNLIGR